VSQWYVFNDFSINPISPTEAVTVNLGWKLPCLFFYHAVAPPPPPEIRDLVRTGNPGSGENRKSGIW
jgi:hypothetical protein